MSRSSPGAVPGSLFRKYLVYLVALVSAALIISGVVGFYFTYNENKAARLDLQREQAAAAASRIESYVQEIERQLGWMRLPQVGPTTLEQRRIDYLKLLRLVPAITDVMLLDATGREQLRVSRLGLDITGADTDLSADPKFTEARGGKTYFSPVYFRKETEPYMTIAVAAMGDQAGVTVAEVNLKFIRDVISRIKIGINGHAYVVDARGRLIAHPDISYVLQKQDLSQLPQVKAAREELKESKAERVTVARSPQGNEVLTAFASITSLGWHVFVEQPLGEAFAPLYSSLERTGLLLLAGLVMAVVVSLFLARHMVTPIRAIQASAARVAAGKLDQRISVKTGDELEALAAQFNRMAERLEASYTDLERKVEERTHELREALAQQTATAEILSVISSWPTNIQPVLDSVAEHAARLCDANDVVVRRIDGGMSRVVAHHGTMPVQPARILSVGTVVGCAILEKRTIHVDDMPAAHARGEFPEAPRSSAYRTLVVVPLVRDGTGIGAIVMRRVEARPFTPTQIKLIETFAAQAVIAIENVRLFDEIQAKSAEVEAANRHKSAFLANVSHELRTPLNAIIGFSEVLRERMFGEINPKQAEYLEDIHSSGKHLLSLINDILNLSKIEAGRMDLELARFDLGEALHGCLNVVREHANRQKLELAIEVSPEIGEWVADERKFKQIMLNLLSNAVKFTPEGGKISVRAIRAGQDIEICVADTGIGIAPDHLEVVFDEFRQVGADHLRKSEGTGLGLALTRAYVELHGGAITVKSDVGIGSTFTFTLPEKALEAA